MGRAQGTGTPHTRSRITLYDTHEIGLGDGVCAHVMSNGRGTETWSVIKGIRFPSTDEVQTLICTNAVVRTAEEDTATIDHPGSNGTSGSTPTGTSGFERSARGSRKFSSDGAASLKRHLKGTRSPLEEVILCSFLVCLKRGYS